MRPTMRRPASYSKELLGPHVSSADIEKPSGNIAIEVKNITYLDFMRKREKERQTGQPSTPSHSPA